MNNKNLIAIDHLIAWDKSDQGEDEASITFYEKALVIYQKTLSFHHPSLAAFYNNIGFLYENMVIIQKHGYFINVLYHELIRT